MTAPKLVGVQYMRALASVMVLIGHVIAEAEHYLRLDLPFDAIPWTRGVDIFFLISGFIIMVSAQKYFGREHGLRQFMWNRVTRVIPLYWFFTTLMLCVLVFMPGGAKDTQMDWAQVATSYLFIPYERYDGRIAPILSLGWTLNYEIFFYAIFSLALLMPRRLGVSAVLLIMLTLTVLGALFPIDHAVWRVWTNTLILEFCFGVVLGLAYLRYGTVSRPGSNGLGLILFAGGFGLLVLLNLEIMAELPRFLASGLPAAVMLAAMVFLWHPHRVDGPLTRFALLLGDSSYALYLSHRFVLRTLTLVILPFIPATQVGGWSFVAIACGAALIGAIAVFYLIEAPMMAFFKRRRTSGLAG